eukprot:2708499-Amphidinium_carterae.1
MTSMPSAKRFCAPMTRKLCPISELTSASGIRTQLRNQCPPCQHGVPLSNRKTRANPLETHPSIKVPPQQSKVFQFRMDWTPGSRDMYASTHATHIFNNLELMDLLNPSMTSCDAYAHETSQNDRVAQTKGPPGRRPMGSSSHCLLCSRSSSNTELWSSKSLRARAR